MTRAAREVLEDCRLSLQMLEEEKDLRRWRVNWAASVALIRAVGHILHKVDCHGSTLLQQHAKQAFARWKRGEGADQLFRDFIDLERNNILKEYEFNLHPLEEVDVALMMTLAPAEGGDAFDSWQVVPIGENIYRPIMEGFREGDDARDVLSEAIDWWQKELDALDDLVRKATKPMPAR